MKKLKYLVITLAVFFLIFPPVFTLALEVNYPSLGPPGQQGSLALGPNSRLPEYVQYVFVFAMLTAGIIGVISIVISGLQILVYAGKPDKVTEARERIFNAIIGIVLLMSSFIIFSTINPLLLSPTGAPLPLQPGVYLTGPGGNAFENLKNSRFAGILNGDIVYAQDGSEGLIYYQAEKDVMDDGDTETLFDSFFYYCGQEDLGTILLWTYGKSDFIIDDSATTLEVECGDKVSLKNVESWRWAIKNAGVYYYMTDDCTGVATYDVESFPAQIENGNIPWFNEGQIDDPDLDQTINSIKIFNDYNQEYNYGLIMTQGAELAGECSEPTFNAGQGKAGELCIALGDADYPQTLTVDGDPFSPWSAYILRQDIKPNSNPKNWGVTFWSPNKQYSLNQYGSVDEQGNPDPTRDIESLWKYDKNSLPLLTDIPDPDDPVNFLPNDGNLDHALRFLGKRANNNQDYPWDECRAFMWQDPRKRDATLFDPPYGKGYLSCIDKITWVGDYRVVLYTSNEDTKEKSCKSFELVSEALFYDRSTYLPHREIPEIFAQFQTIYRTIVIPERF